MTKASPDAGQLVGGHSRPDAAAANKNATLTITALQLLRHRDRVVRIVIGAAGIVRTEVRNDVSQLSYLRDHPVHQRSAAVIGGHGNSHG
jgi:hypothetical protein